MVAIVLLPGMDGTGALFVDFVSALGSKFRPIVVCYPKNQPLGYRELEEYARRHLPRNEPYIVLGESFSGPVAISLVASKPPLLLGLVLCCSFSANPHPWLKPLRHLVRFAPLKSKYAHLLTPFLLGRFASASMEKAVKLALEDVSEDVLRKRLQEVFSADFDEILGDVEVPVLYLQASEDRIVPRSALRRIARRMPKMQSIRVAAPHLLLQAAPKEAAIAIERFVATIDRPLPHAKGGQAIREPADRGIG